MRTTESLGEPAALHVNLLIQKKTADDDDDVCMPMWPQGQIIRPQLRPHSFWPQPRSRPHGIWHRPHKNWPRGLEKIFGPRPRPHTQLALLTSLPER